jgi:hypothetical protein
MAINIGGSQVVNNSAQVGWGSLTGLPGGMIFGLSVSAVGDNTNPIGSSGVIMSSASFSGNVLYCQFNTNCACDCACACACDCACGGGN